MNAPQLHTYGPACRLAAVVEPEPDDPLLDGIPPINAQFFYHSLVPIDDPLSTATVPVSSDSKASRAVLRPFSQADNNALERAWLSLVSESLRASHQASLAKTGISPALAAANSKRVQNIVNILVRRHKEKHAQEAQSTTILEAPSDALASSPTPVCCQELLIDASNLLRENFCNVTRRKQRELDQTNVIESVMAAMDNHRPAPISVPQRIAPRPTSTSSPRAEAFVAPGLSVSLAWDNVLSYLFVHTRRRYQSPRRSTQTPFPLLKSSFERNRRHELTRSVEDINPRASFFASL